MLPILLPLLIVYVASALHVLAIAKIAGPRTPEARRWADAAQMKALDRVRAATRPTPTQGA